MRREVIFEPSGWEASMVVLTLSETPRCRVPRAAMNCCSNSFFSEAPLSVTRLMLLAKGSTSLASAKVTTPSVLAGLDVVSPLKSRSARMPPGLVMPMSGCVNSAGTPSRSALPTRSPRADSAVRSSSPWMRGWTGPCPHA